ncbi:MAG: putative PHP family metal-dependent phosphoesterase, partial [Parcubacteria group bacterium Gr01-1014_19]
GCEQHYDEHTSVFRASLKDNQEALYLHGHVESFSCSPDSKWFYQKEEKSPIIHWNALEVVNFHANALDNKFGLLGSIFFDPSSLYNNITGLIPKNFDYWQKLSEREGRPIPIFGAPDAHQNQKYFGIQVDPYELTLGMISTHIWLENDVKLNQESIFEAIKKGRTYIAFDYLADPTGFKFYAETMKEKCMTGETMVSPKYLSVYAPCPDSEVITKFYCDNVLIGEVPGSMTYMPNPQPGFWRVELWKNERPWIISGQIHVK